MISRAMLIEERVDDRILRATRQNLAPLLAAVDISDDLQSKHGCVAATSGRVHDVVGIRRMAARQNCL